MNAWLRVTDSDGVAYLVPEAYAVKVVAETETDDEIILTIERHDGERLGIIGRKADT